MASFLAYGRRNCCDVTMCIRGAAIDTIRTARSTQIMGRKETPPREVSTPTRAQWRASADSRLQAYIVQDWSNTWKMHNGSRAGQTPQARAEFLSKWSGVVAVDGETLRTTLGWASVRPILRLKMDDVRLRTTRGARWTVRAL